MRFIKQVARPRISVTTLLWCDVVLIVMIATMLMDMVAR